MIKEYLEKIQDQLYQNKLEIYNKLVYLETTYKENTEMIRMLEETNDSTFQEFTPRELNSFSSGKVIELKQSQTLLLVDIEETKIELQKAEDAIKEINLVMKKQISQVNSLENLESHISKAIDFVYSDVYKCKQELTVAQQIIQNL